MIRWTQQKELRTRNISLTRVIDTSTVSDEAIERRKIACAKKKATQELQSTLNKFYGVIDYVPRSQ